MSLCVSGESSAHAECRRHPLARLALLVSATLLALAALACLGSLALATTRPLYQSSLRPIILHAANVGLSIATTNNPDCPPMLPGCMIVPQPNRSFLSIWFSVTTRDRGGFTISARPLLKLRLR